MRAWAELAASAGQPAWYRSSGNLEWAGDAQAHAELAARVRRLTEWGYPAGFLDAASALELEPALRLPAPAAEVAWFPGEGYLLTEPAVGYLVDLAVGYGARVLTGEPGRVTGFGPLAGQSPAGGGRAVQTAGGELIEADVVVVLRGTLGSGAGPAGGRDSPGAAGAVGAARRGSTRSRGPGRPGVRSHPDGARPPRVPAAPRRRADPSGGPRRRR